MALTVVVVVRPPVGMGDRLRLVGRGRHAGCGHEDKHHDRKGPLAHCVTLRARTIADMMAQWQFGAQLLFGNLFRVTRRITSRRRSRLPASFEPMPRHRQKVLCM